MIPPTQSFVQVSHGLSVIIPHLPFPLFYIHEIVKVTLCNLMVIRIIQDVAFLGYFWNTEGFLFLNNKTGFTVKSWINIDMVRNCFPIRSTRYHEDPDKYTRHPRSGIRLLSLLLCGRTLDGRFLMQRWLFFRGKRLSMSICYWAKFWIVHKFDKSIFHGRGK